MNRFDGVSIECGNCGTKIDDNWDVLRANFVDYLGELVEIGAELRETS